MVYLSTEPSSNIFVKWSCKFWKPRFKDNLGNTSTESELHRSVNNRNEIWKFRNFRIFKESKADVLGIRILLQQVLHVYLALPRLRVEGKIISENFRWWDPEVPYVFQKYSLLADPVHLLHRSWNVGGDTILAPLHSPQKIKARF